MCLLEILPKPCKHVAGVFCGCVCLCNLETFLRKIYRRVAPLALCIQFLSISLALVFAFYLSPSFSIPLSYKHTNTHSYATRSECADPLFQPQRVADVAETAESCPLRRAREPSNPPPSAGKLCSCLCGFVHAINQPAVTARSDLPPALRRRR